MLIKAFEISSTNGITVTTKLLCVDNNGVGHHYQKDLASNLSAGIEYSFKPKTGYLFVLFLL